MAWEPTRFSIIVSVDVSANVPQVTFQYVEIDSFSGFPREVTDVPDRYMIPRLSEELKADVENELYYSEVFAHMSDYRKANRRRFLNDLKRLSLKDSSQMIKDFIRRRLK